MNNRHTESRHAILARPYIKGRELYDLLNMTKKELMMYFKNSR